jgi:hypothetical protein
MKYLQVYAKLHQWLMETAYNTTIDLLHCVQELMSLIFRLEAKYTD